MLEITTQNYRVLIRISVMDLGCGKGGDLKKFHFDNISNYVGIDISQRGLRDAVIRKVESNINFPALFYCMSGDLDPEQFDQTLPPLMHFDVVSAQFCIHYFFSTEMATRNFLKNVSCRLTKGGTFVATLPDAEVLMEKLGQKKSTNEANDYIYNSKYFSLIMAERDFSNELCYGIKYGFFLDDGLIGVLIRNEGRNSEREKNLFCA